MPNKPRLMLTSDELYTVKDELFEFVKEVCEEPYKMSSAEIEVMPQVADLLLTHFGG